MSKRERARVCMLSFNVLVEAPAEKLIIKYANQLKNNMVLIDLIRNQVKCKMYNLF